MKLGRRLYGRVTELRNRLFRARYFRGHGVHSPFVYDLVREVFMRRELLLGDHTLYNTLLKAGIAQGRAIELQNLAIRCGYATFGLNRADRDLCVVTRDTTCDRVLELVQQASREGHTVAIMSPCEGRERQALCHHIVAAHGSTTVDNRGYLLILNNHLPKQHFRI